MELTTKTETDTGNYTRVTEHVLHGRVNDKIWMGMHVVKATTTDSKTYDFTGPQRALQVPEDRMTMRVMFPTANMDNYVFITLSGQNSHPLRIENNIPIVAGALQPGFMYQIFFSADDNMWYVENLGFNIANDEVFDEPIPADPVKGMTPNDIKSYLINNDLWTAEWRIHKEDGSPWDKLGALDENEFIGAKLHGEILDIYVLGNSTETKPKRTNMVRNKTYFIEVDVDGNVSGPDATLMDAVIESKHMNICVWYAVESETALYANNSGTADIAYGLHSSVSVPNANQAKNADTLDGYHQSTFVRNNANAHIYMNNHDITEVNDIYPNGNGNSSNNYQCGNSSKKWWEVWAIRGIFDTNMLVMSAEETLILKDALGVEAQEIETKDAETKDLFTTEAHDLKEIIIKMAAKISELEGKLNEIQPTSKS